MGAEPSRHPLAGAALARAPLTAERLDAIAADLREPGWAARETALRGARGLVRQITADHDAAQAGYLMESQRLHPDDAQRHLGYLVELRHALSHAERCAAELETAITQDERAGADSAGDRLLTALVELVTQALADPVRSSLT